MRAKVVNAVFDSLDTNKDDMIEAEELKTKFDATMHPAVIAGRKTAKQVMDDFISAYELYASCYGVGTKDGKLTRKEFIEYYTYISANIDSDEYFVEMMKNGWQLSQGQIEPTAQPEPTKPVEEIKEKAVTAPAPQVESPPPPAQEQPAPEQKAEVKEEEKKPSPPTEPETDGAVKRFRESVLSRGVRGILGVERQFKVYTKADRLELDDFKKAVEDFRLRVDVQVCLIS